MMKLQILRFFPMLLMQLITSAVFGQQAGHDGKALQAKVDEALKVSMEVVKQYTWNARTDVTRDGKVVDILIEEFSYGADGKLVKKTINDQEAKLPSSFIAHDIAEEVKGKLVAFMNSLHVFLKEYAMEDDTRRNAFFAGAVVGDPDPAGLVLVSGRDVIVKGDKLLWWIDTHNYAVVKASVSTLFEGDQVEFTTSNKCLPTGLQYMAFAEVLVPEKSMVVQLHFYDFTRHD